MWFADILEPSGIIVRCVFVLHRSVEAVVDDGDLLVTGDHARMLVVRRSEFGFVEWSIPGGGSVFIPRGVVNSSTGECVMY